jgi:hypothetical protein
MEDFMGLYALNWGLIYLYRIFVSHGNGLAVKRNYINLTRISDFGEIYILSPASVN